MKHKYFIWSVVGAFPSSMVMAQDSKSLEDTVIVASRYEKEAGAVSAAVSDFDADAIRKFQPRTFADLFNYEPGVEFVGGPRQTAQEVQIRGEGGNAVTVRIDGARQNFVTGHSGQRFHVDPELIRRGEILRGAGSHLYGSGGAGVVALETWNASDFLGSDAGIDLSTGKDGIAGSSFEESFRWGGRLKAGYASGNDEMLYTGTGAVAQGAWDFLAAYVYRDGGDVRLGNGEDSAGSAIRVNNYLFKAGYNVDQNQRFEFSYSNYQADDSNGANPAAEANPILNSPVDRETTNQQLRLAYNWSPQNHDWVDLKSTLYWNETIQERFYQVNSGLPNFERHNEYSLQTLGFDAVNRSQYEAVGAQHNLISGFEFYKDDQTGDDSRTDFQGPNGEGSSAGRPDADSSTYAFFLQNDSAWSNGISTVFGIRYDASKSSSENGRDQSDDQFSPHFEIRYEPLEGIGVFGNYAHSFTAPTLNEVYNSGSHFGNVPTGFHPTFGFPTDFYEEIWVPNEDLNAASSENIELGIDFNKELSSGRINGRVSWYQKNGSDTISYETVGSVTSAVPIYGPFLPAANFQQDFIQARNVEETKIQGWEATLSYTADLWYLTSSLSILDGEDSNTGEKLNTIPGDKVTLEAGYKALEDLTVGTRALWVSGREDKVESVTAKTSGYDIYGVFADWRVTQDLTIAAGVHNIFDQEYEITNVNNTQPGRSIYVNASYSF